MLLHFKSIFYDPGKISIKKSYSCHFNVYEHLVIYKNVIIDNILLQEIGFNSFYRL